MIDLYSASIVVFVLALVAIVYKDRKKFSREFIILLRKTQKGKGSIIRLGRKFPRFWKALGVVGVIIGFVISVWIFYMFVVLTAQNIMSGGGGGLSLVLPSASAEPAVGPGYLAVPFWYWIIVIGCLALVHEGLHGIMAASQKVPIKSLGWGLLLVIPLAFVEPDEKQLQKMGSWVQLRVFAAGSFANFMLAGLSVLLLSWMAFSFYVPGGVTFQGYPGAAIAPSSIITVNNHNISSPEEIKTHLQGIDNKTLVEIHTENEKYYSYSGRILKNLESEKVPVYDAFDAVKKNLTGTITSMNGFGVSDTSDLRESLEKIGPREEVEVITATEKGENKTFKLVTKTEPHSSYSPDLNSMVVLWFEQYIPGTVDTFNSVSEWWSSAWGNQQPDNWRTKDNKIAFWSYVKNNYPLIKDRAEQRIEKLRAEQEQYKQAGFLGIANVITKYDIKTAYQNQKMGIEFFNGLLFWMFLINFGVGAFNLLPIRILDGGRMWEILLKRFTKKYRQIMRGISTATVLLLLINFAIIAGITF